MFSISKNKSFSMCFNIVFFLIFMRVHVFIGFHLYSYVFMCVHGCSCVFMCVHGCSWVFMGVHGCSWVFMGVHGCSWVFMGVHGCSCVLCVFFEKIFQNLFLIKKSGLSSPSPSLSRAGIIFKEKQGPEFKFKPLFSPGLVPSLKRNRARQPKRQA